MNERIGYFDCFAGISGDMCLGALVDAGADPGKMAGELQKLKIGDYSLGFEKVRKGGLAGTKANVVIKEHQEHHSHGRTWKDIVAIISDSMLPNRVKQKGMTVFRLLFDAEAAVHGECIDSVHLHEVGADDCLIDVFGTIIGLELLGIGRVHASPVNLGSGTVNTSHGILPVPAPATARILQGSPVYGSSHGCELTTPTGAAILIGLGAQFTPLPPLVIGNTGYGAGTRDIPGLPNLLRFMAGTPSAESGSQPLPNRVTVIEANIDDMNPQWYEPVMENLFSAGALDVCLIPVIMKKGRPGIILSVIAGEAARDILAEIILRETTTLGIRFSSMDRKTLDREIRTIETPFGSLRVKIAKCGDTVINAAPEYEDIRAIASNSSLTVKKVYAEISGALAAVCR